MYDGEASEVRIGSQADPAFLNSVVAEMGGIDVLIDDGGHMASHQRASFDFLFPRLTGCISAKTRTPLIGDGVKAAIAGRARSSRDQRR